MLQGVEEIGWEAALSGERIKLVRLCAQLTGNAEAAEDLAQETLVKALCHMQQLRDRARRAQWLYAIARNECLQWARSRGRELARRAPATPGGDLSASIHEDALADDFDVEVELERAELAQLLDRALALLPPTMRNVLVERYVQEASLAEVAARLRLSEGAVAKRLERGKLILRRVLTTELSGEAAAYGVIPGDTDGWRETRIWCITCGDRRFLGRWVQDGEYNELLLRCPVCCPDPKLRSWHVRERYLPGLTFQDIRGFKAALSRVMKWSAGYVRPGQRTARCISCGRAAPIFQDYGENLPRDCGPGGPHIHSYVWCPACGVGLHSTLPDRIFNLAETQRFWREHPRLRLLPEREVEAAGGPALVTSFESITGGARLDVVTARDAFEIISIHGAPPL